VPSAGAVTVAVARAETVAGASTTSTTVARPTSATSTSGPEPPVQPATDSAATASTVATRPRCPALPTPHRRLAPVLHLRLVVPAEKVGAVLDCLSSSPAVTNVVHLPGAALEPAGDLVLGDVAREAASEVLETLKGHDLVRLGSISADEVSLSLSDAARAAEQAAPGLGTDAVVWRRSRRGRPRSRRCPRPTWCSCAWPP
jgi:hypothetical protein